MTTFIAGGTGFIGRRLVPLLAQRGEEIVCMDIAPQTANFSALGTQVRVVRGDVSQFDDIMARMVEAKPDRVVNLAYYIGSDLPPRVAFKLNVLGMDNCFEAARLAGCNRVVYASSLAVSGEQKHYGERIVTEEDFRHGHVQYAMHKIFNEWQAQDYRDQDLRLGRSCVLHHPAGPRTTGQLPLPGRDALPGACRRDRRDLCPRRHEG
jgi:nucleoside-diphosphate-sugar epimerase